MKVTEGLPDVPGLRDAAAWQEPPTPALAARAVMAVCAFVYQEKRSDKVRELAPLLEARYTAGEVAWAARELIYDPALDDKRRYKGELTAADFERVIRDRATLVQSLRMKLTERERDKLILRWPRDLGRRDFGCCGYNSFNEPVFIYLPRRAERCIEPARFEVVK